MTYYRGQHISSIHVPAKFDESIGGYVPLDAIWTGDSDFIMIHNELLVQIIGSVDYTRGARFKIPPFELELVDPDTFFSSDAWVAKRVVTNAE